MILLCRKLRRATKKMLKREGERERNQGGETDEREIESAFEICCSLNC